MAKLLKPMVVVLLVLSVAALVLGIMLFSEREIIKGRTQTLESNVMDVAGSLRYDEIQREELMDAERMNAALNRLNVHAGLTYQDLQDTRQDLADKREQLNEARTDLRVAREELEQAEQRVAQLQDDVTERTAELARVNQQVNQLEREKDGLQARIDDAEARMAQMEEENLELAERISEQQALIAEYEGELFVDDAAIGTPEGLTGRILVVMPEWNFVVLDIGSEQGLSLQTEMLVHREEQLVGRVRVSSVENQLAVAEIMTDWQLDPLREGDHVLF